MRTHADIITRDVSAFAAKVGMVGKEHTVRSWRARGSIPRWHWQAVADAGLATLDELVAGAPERKSDMAA